MPVRRIVFVCLALMAGCARPTVPSSSPDDAIIYVIERDWHTDIGLPVEDIAGPLRTLTASFPGVRFLTFGFGERQFLLNRSRGAGAMLSALLPSESALLMTALKATPWEAFGPANVVTLPVSRAGLKAIEDKLWREFERSSAGDPILLTEGPYPGSVYYAANDTYSGIFTCNTWTADMLRAGGLPVRSAGVLLSGQIMDQVRWIDTHKAISPVD